MKKRRMAKGIASSWRVRDPFSYTGLPSGQPTKNSRNGSSNF